MGWVDGGSSLLLISLQLSTPDDQLGWVSGGPPPHCSCHFNSQLPSYYSPGHRHGEINPQWSHPGISTSGQSSCSTIVEGDCSLEQEVCVTAGHALVQMHVTDWAKAQKEDTMLSAVLNWLKAQKETDLMALLAEHASSNEGKLLLHGQQNFTVYQGALYLCSMPKGETKDLCGAQAPLGHHLEWVSSRCGSSWM